MTLVAIKQEDFSICFRASLLFLFLLCDSFLGRPTCARTIPARMKAFASAFNKTKTTFSAASAYQVRGYLPNIFFFLPVFLLVSSFSLYLIIIDCTQVSDVRRQETKKKKLSFPIYINHERPPLQTGNHLLTKMGISTAK